MWQKVVPGHLGQRDSSRSVSDSGLEQCRPVRRDDSFVPVGHEVRLLAGHRLEVGHQHGRRLDVNHPVAACFYLLQRRCVDRNGCLRWPSAVCALRCCSSLDFAVQWDAAILRVDGAVVTQKQITPDECAPTFEAFERSFFGVYIDRRDAVSHLAPPLSRARQAPPQEKTMYLRDLSCRLRCSLLLNARLQNWHLYFFSGADVVLRPDEGVAEVAGRTVMAAAGIEKSQRLAAGGTAWIVFCPPGACLH